MTVVHPRRDVYTDGACSGSPGPGGWAWALDDQSLHGSGSEAATTNQRMELTAALEAMLALCPFGYRICIVSDSAYLINCFEQRWYVKWDHNNWMTPRGPVANQDLWGDLVGCYQRYDITFRKVKGHSGDKMNDYVDGLAVAAKHSIMR